mgnify:CR=1 FL=1
MITIDEALIRKVAHLARLELTEAEVNQYTDQIGKIIHYVQQLEGAEVEGVIPLLHPLDILLSSREDQIQPFAPDHSGKPRVLSAAPDVLYDGFKVPKIL